MRRKTLDALLASTGAVIALVLLVAGGLLTWANTYIDGQNNTYILHHTRKMLKKAATARSRRSASRSRSGGRSSCSSRAGRWTGRSVRGRPKRRSSWL